MKQFEIEERNSVALLCEKMTDEEIDTYYGNPGVAKYVRAFAEGKTVFAKVCESWYPARTKNFFDAPRVSKRPWRVFTEELTNNIED